MLDVLISVLNSFLAILLAGVGIWVGMYPPNVRDGARSFLKRKSTKFLAAFVILTAGIVGLSIWQVSRNSGQQSENKSDMKHLQDDLKKANSSLDSTKESLRISDTTLNTRLGQIDGAITQFEQQIKHGNPSPDSLIKALRQLSSTPIQTAAGPVMPPSMPSPGPASPVPQPTVASVQDDLRRLVEQIRNTKGILVSRIGVVYEDFARPYKMGLPGPPSELPAAVITQLADAEKNANDEYKFFEPQIRKAHDAALAHLHLTPTQAAADTAKFEEANREAEKLTSLADLRANNLDAGRYEKIVDYLSQLADRLAAAAQ
jgi:hypothetical protein